MAQFSAPKQTEATATPQSCTRHDVFHSFLYDERKQYSTTTTVHIKSIIELLNHRHIISDKLSTLYRITYGCAAHYRCSTALYLMSMLSQAFSVIIYCGISASGNDREVADRFNAIDKRFIFQLILTVQLTGAKGYSTHMIMHTGTRTSCVSLARELKNTCFMRYANIE